MRGSGAPSYAWREYRSAAARAQGEGQAPRAKFAAGRAVEIEAKLVRAQVVPAHGGDVRALRIDGDRVDGDLTVIHLEPGRHVIDVTTSAGDRPVVVDARAGQSDLRIEVPAIAQVAPPAAAAAPAEPTPGSSDTKKMVGWSLVGLGAVGLGLGTYFGLQDILGEERRRGALQRRRLHRRRQTSWRSSPHVRASLDDRIRDWRRRRRRRRRRHVSRLRSRRESPRLGGG